MQEMALNAGLWPQVLAVGLGVFVVLAAAGLPFLALRALTLGVRLESSRHAHLARQQLSLCRLLTWWCVLVGGGALFLPDLRGLLRGPVGIPLLVAAGGFVAGAACCTVTLANWKSATGTRRLLTWLTGFCLLTGLLAGLCVLLKIFCPLEMREAGALVSALVSGAPLDAVFSPALRARILFVPYSALYALASLPVSAACLAMLWLVLRRNADDFGRDYYAFALRWCARGAFIGSFVFLAGGILLFLLRITPLLHLPEASLETMTATLRAVLGSAADPGFRLGGPESTPFFGLLPLFLAQILLPDAAFLLAWMRIEKMDVPMRAKLSILLGTLCVWASLCCSLILIPATRIPQV